MKKNNVFNYILMLLFGFGMLFVNNDNIQTFNYLFVSIFSLLFVINFLDFTNIEKNKLAILFLWLSIFNYIYYYKSLYQLIIVISISIYLLFVNNLIINNNRLVYYFTNIISFILIIGTYFNTKLFIVIGGIYCIIYNLYAMYNKNKKILS